MKSMFTDLSIDFLVPNVFVEHWWTKLRYFQQELYLISYSGSSFGMQGEVERICPKNLKFEWIVFPLAIFDAHWSQDCCSMGGACSRKRDQQVDEDSVHRGVSGRYCKSGSSKWLGTSFSRLSVDIKQGKGKCPSLMELCIRRICEVCVYIYIYIILYLESLVRILTSVMLSVASALTYNRI